MTEDNAGNPPDPQALAVPDTARCRTCGYALKGLCEPRCPECGESFEPGDVTTYVLTRRRRYYNRLSVLVPWCVVAIVASVLLDVPVKALVLFPSWLWSDSTFWRDRLVWAPLTLVAFVLLIAHPVYPHRSTAALTALGIIGWWLLAAITFAIIASASV